ncbi:hypothetical protein CHS0354_039073 [Potamilus streckersoni]|uniref:VWFD domain-containing protein n=1 Tax=Potamilus streckersoni TaxID=2493646 RepID=A0AAE0RRV8_9BIVA|nr:hypothetical protein CHS0354_039073 [Potamilus streckersoni]
MCCYHSSVDQHFVPSGPYAGGYIRYNPWFFQNWHERDDLEMRVNCCDKSDLCNIYQSLRPIGGCYTTFPLQFGNLWGDPHIQTLDGRTYTFNGYGEYTLLNLDSDNTSFIIQARTSRAEKADGKVSDASIFSAFSAKDDRGAQVQVELNSSKTDFREVMKDQHLCRVLYTPQERGILGGNMDERFCRRDDHRKCTTKGLRKNWNEQLQRINQNCGANVADD